MAETTTHRGERYPGLDLGTVATDLATLYPSRLALLLVPLCSPARPHSHGATPCTAPGKVPFARGWAADAVVRYEDPEADTAEHLARMAAHLAGGGNVGWVVPPGTLVLDADTLEAVAHLEARLPEGPSQESRPGRGHYLVRAPEAPLRARCRVDLAPGVAVDLRCGGRSQIVVEPSRHATGAHYTWVRRLLADLGRLPELPEALLAPIVEQAGEERQRPNGRGNGADHEGGPIPEGERNATLASYAGAMRRRGMAPEEILAGLQAINSRRCDPPLPDDEVARIARSVGRYEPAGGVPHPDTEDGPASDVSDVANARRLADAHGCDLRYVRGIGWLAWDGRRWSAEDGEHEALRRASTLGRIVQREAAQALEAASQTADEAQRERLEKQAERLHRWARDSEREQRIRAALALARPLLALGPDALDARPWLLTVANGTVDLRTGELRPHRRDDYLTRLTPVRYDPHARSEEWERVLDRALPDAEVREWLQRAAGYTACGETGEDVLLLIHGLTRTAKGTIQGAIAAALGEYAVTAGLEDLAERKHRDGRAPRPELVRLRGARMVSIYETGRAMRLDHELVKTLAGSDPITARGLHRDPITFRPEATVWLATNHRPRVDADDDALWERLREVPFEVQIPENERDRTLRARLADPEASGPAVLAWIAAGARRWQAEGLAAPEAVRGATRAYRAEADRIGAWVGACCLLRADAWTTAASLRESYDQWCRAEGERPLGGQRWREALRGLGCEAERRYRGRGWRGIGLVEGEGMTP